MSGVLVGVALLLLIGGGVAQQDNSALPTLRIASIISEPFLRVVSDDSSLGNDQYEGFIKDILDSIAAFKGFNYELILSKDGKYGSVNSETGEWNGMIGMAKQGEVDVIAADLTVTWNRMAVLDFSKPFMASKLTVLMKRWDTTGAMESWFAPFSWGVWLILLAAYLVSGLVLWLVGRIAPKETQPDSTATPLTLRNSYWYLIACWFRASPFHPNAWSTRLVSCSWWMFYITCIITYFLLLPPHLATPPLSANPNTMNQLLASGATFGVVQYGATQQLLENSAHPVHQNIWQKVNDNVNVSLVESYAEGYQRVMAEPGFGLVMEDTGAKFLKGRDETCDLYTVGDLQDRHFAFGFTKGSRYRAMFSQSLLRITERGLLSAARSKWWPENENCYSDTPKVTECHAPRTVLSISDLAPPLIFLLVALILALIIALLELVLHRSTTVLPTHERPPSLVQSLKSACCPCLAAPKSAPIMYKPVRPSVATQTVLWASSRATTPSRATSPLSQRIF